VSARDFFVHHVIKVQIKGVLLPLVSTAAAAYITQFKRDGRPEQNPHKGAFPRSTGTCTDHVQRLHGTGMGFTKVKSRKRKK
jgi:hypothetical protein